MAVCNPNTILSEAACFMCLTPGQTELVITQLLCNIAVNGGGGAGTCNSAGTGSPEGVVTANPGCTYLDTSNDFYWVKRTGSGNTGWLNLIS